MSVEGRAVTLREGLSPSTAVLDASDFTAVRRRLRAAVAVTVPAGLLTSAIDYLERGLAIAWITAALMVFIFAAWLWIRRSNTLWKLHTSAYVMLLGVTTALLAYSYLDMFPTPAKFGMPYWLALPVLAAAIILGNRAAVVTTAFASVGLVITVLLSGLEPPWNWADVVRRIVFLLVILGVAAAGRRISDRQMQALRDQQDMLTTQAAMLEEAIDERQAAQAELAKSFGHVLRAASDGIIEFDEHAVIIDANRAAAELFQHDERDLVGLSLRDLVPGWDALVSAHGTEPERQSVATASRFETDIVDARGQPLHAEWSISARESGADVRYVAIVRDISERTAMEQRLYRQANFDDLTGLPNRTFLHEYLDGVLTSDHRFERFSGVLLANIDDFRAVQDSLGLAVGDSALVIVADRLRACAGPDDIVARFTGDSFAIVCMNPTQDVTAVGEAVVKAFDDPCDLGPNQIVLSVSAGVAADDGSRSTAADFLRDAGAAMNRAKQLGRSRVQVYDTQIRSMAIERFDIDTALHGALAARELFLVYQHIVDLQSGNVVGAEALLRWDRPGHGVVSPIVFVPRLEATGLIVDVGRWVLGQACADLATWQGRAQPGEARHSMSINVANRQLANGDFPDIVAATISDNDLAAEDIVLEVTESEFFDAHAPGSASIEELKRVGVRVAIDDFGTGYSSLSQMRSMRVDEIKIDKAFVDPIVDDSVGAAVVRTVARLGNHLGLTVVAEGVESAEQATLLRGMGCHLAQGYYFARPERAETSLGA